MIESFDDFLEEHVAQLFDLHMREISWKYDYSSYRVSIGMRNDNSHFQSD